MAESRVGPASASAAVSGPSLRRRAIRARRAVLFGVAAGLSAAVGAAPAQEHAHAAHMPPVARVELSAELKQLLIKEMVAVQSGMQDLLPAIATGDWRKIAEIGRAIHDGYIMHQSLTPAQAEELRRVLPERFRELDHEFHHTAALLAAAARNRDPGLVNHYFYKLTETCLSCHARYAGHRFPGLVPGFDHIEQP